MALSADFFSCRKLVQRIFQIVLPYVHLFSSSFSELLSPKFFASRKEFPGVPRLSSLNRTRRNLFVADSTPLFTISFLLPALVTVCLYPLYPCLVFRPLGLITFSTFTFILSWVI